MKTAYTQPQMEIIEASEDVHLLAGSSTDSEFSVSVEGTAGEDETGL